MNDKVYIFCLFVVLKCTTKFDNLFGCTHAEIEDLKGFTNL